jgi:hypothetical protein
MAALRARSVTSTTSKTTNLETFVLCDHLSQDLENVFRNSVVVDANESFRFRVDFQPFVKAQRRGNRIRAYMVIESASAFNLNKQLASLPFELISSPCDIWLMKYASRSSRSVGNPSSSVSSTARLISSCCCLPCISASSFAIRACRLDSRFKAFRNPGSVRLL